MSQFGVDISTVAMHGGGVDGLIAAVSQSDPQQEQQQSGGQGQSHDDHPTPMDKDDSSHA